MYFSLHYYGGSLPLFAGLLIFLLASALAVYTALALGYDEIILCGVPLDDSHHYFDPDWRKCSFTKQVPLKGNGQIKYWADAQAKVFQGKVTARSGRLTEILH